MIKRLGMDLLELRVSELGRRTVGLALPAGPCCSCCTTSCGSKIESA